MSTQKQVQLAKSLPPRLLRFFQKYPPPALFQQTPAAVPTAPAPVSTTAPTDPNASPLETPAPVNGTAEIPSSSPDALEPELPYHNPFLPIKSHLTGRWRGAEYGLRKQADLVKLAKTHGVLDLLPWTIKKPGEKEKRRIENGLQVKGTGQGQRVKGKRWERTLSSRLAMRQKAMLDMPALIQEWKQVRSPCQPRIIGDLTDNRIERSWQRMEEVAVWESQVLKELAEKCMIIWTIFGTRSKSFLAYGCHVYSTCIEWIDQHIIRSFHKEYHDFCSALLPTLLFAALTLHKYICASISRHARSYLLYCKRRHA